MDTVPKLKAVLSLLQRQKKRVFIPDGMCSQGKLQRPQQSPVCSSACTYLSDYSDVNINPPRLSSKFVGFFWRAGEVLKQDCVILGRKRDFVIIAYDILIIASI